MDSPVATREDYYALLGVSQFAGFEVIKEAYRRLALRFHPDKNKADNATAEFQKLGRAWETLKDERRRKDYDRDYVYYRIRGSKNDEGCSALSPEVLSEMVRKRREDIDRDVKRRWEQTSSRASSVTSPVPEEEIRRVERARLWKQVAKKDYTLRLQNWMDFRKRQIIAIQHYRVLVRRYEQQMEDQSKESEQQMIATFTQAIKISESGGQKMQNHSDVISALMEAKRVYTINLSLAGQASKGRLKQLLDELENWRRWYEDEEMRTRQSRIREAFDILGQNHFNTPLFSVIDRRQQAINYWKALSRVKKAVKFFPCLKDEESPWHEGGNWQRLPGEFTCGRCEQPAFHIILACGPAQCPKCSMVVCNDCHRDLEILREYEAWMTSTGDPNTSLFSLEFEEGARPMGSWDGPGIGAGRCWM